MSERERKRLIAKLKGELGPTSEQPMDERKQLLAKLQEALSPQPLAQELGDAALAGAERGAMNFVSGALGMREPPKSTVGAIMTGASPNTLLNIARLMYNRSGFLGAGEPRSSEDAVNQAFQESRARNAIERATDVPSSFVSDYTLKAGGVELPIGLAAGAIPEVVAESAPALLSAPLLGGVRAIGAEALGATAGGVGRGVDKQIGNEFPFFEVALGLATPSVKTARSHMGEADAQRRAEHIARHNQDAFSGVAREAKGDVAAVKANAQALQKQAEKAIQKLEDRAAQRLAEAAPGADRERTNIAARTAALDIEKRLDAAEGSLWDELDVLLDTEVGTVSPRFIEVWKAIQKEHRDGVARTASKEITGPMREKGLTYNDMKQRRSALQEESRAASRNGNKALSRYYGLLADNLTTEMRDVASQHGMLEQFDKARALSLARNKRIRDNPAMERLIGERESMESTTRLDEALGSDPRGASRELTASTRGHPEESAVIRRSLGDLVRGNFAKKDTQKARERFLRDDELLKEFSDVRAELEEAAKASSIAAGRRGRAGRHAEGGIIAGMARDNADINSALKSRWGAGTREWKRTTRLMQRNKAAREGQQAWVWENKVLNEGRLASDPEKFATWYRGHNKLRVDAVLSDDQIRFMKRLQLGVKYAKKRGAPNIIATALARVTGATAGATLATTTPGTGLIAASIGSSTARKALDKRAERSAAAVMDVIVHDPQLLQRALKKDKRLFAAAPIVAAIQDASSEDEE